MDRAEITDASPEAGFFYVLVPPGIPVWKGDNKEEAVAAFVYAVVAAGEELGKTDADRIGLIDNPRPSTGELRDKFPATSVSAIDEDMNLISVIYGVTVKEVHEIREKMMSAGLVH